MKEGGGGGKPRSETEEGGCASGSIRRRNRSRDSEAPMHIIGRPCRLIRRTLQSRCRANIAPTRRETFILGAGRERGRESFFTVSRFLLKFIYRINIVSYAIRKFTYRWSKKVCS